MKGDRISMSTPYPSDPKAEAQSAPLPETPAPARQPEAPVPAETTANGTYAGPAGPGPDPGPPTARPGESEPSGHPGDRPAPALPVASEGFSPGDPPAMDEADIARLADEASFGAILDQFEQQHHAEVSVGETVEGCVITVTPAQVLVDIGSKREGAIPVAELTTDSGEVKVKPGDTVRVTVTGHGAGGYYQLSTAKTRVPTDWSALEAAYAEKSVISGTVLEAIKGGLRVDVGVRAFMPASRSGARDQAELEALVGQQISCRITKLDTAKEDVVVDRRIVLQEEAAAARENAFGSLREGDVVKGKVRSLTDFGAFIDLGGIDGLLHVADIAWSRVKKPSDVLSEGEEVEVKIVKIDRKSRRISLSRKELIPDPWTAAAGNYKAGDRVRGKVSRVADFGAFVTLEPGIDGLIHVSEMSWSRKMKKASEIVRRGEEVEVVVLSVNAADRRIALGLKQALGDPWESVAEQYKPGSIHEVTVGNLAKFGAFVELAEGVEGLIHISDITNERRLTHPKDMLSEGQQVRVTVLELDSAKKRIRLGMKQLEPTSADEYIAGHAVGDVVTGRFVDVSKKPARVELGEGVTATCPLAPAAEQAAPKEDDLPRPDLSAMTAMLAARWKSGGASASSARSAGPRQGQVSSFRITSLDPQSKKIEVELAD